MRNGLLLCLAIAMVAVAPPNDGAVITNSGSTNTARYTIAVWSNGTAKLSVAGQPTRAFQLDPDVTAHFFRDVRASKRDPGVAQHCMKSASFGTATVVAWHDFTSPDLQCPPLNASVGLLAEDVRAITAAANPDTHVQHLHLPGESRMIPAATPEVTPT